MSSQPDGNDDIEVLQDETQFLLNDRDSLLSQVQTLKRQIHQLSEYLQRLPKILANDRYLDTTGLGALWNKNVQTLVDETKP